MRQHHLLLFAGLLAGSPAVHATPVGSAFHYQGRLLQSGQAASNWVYQIQFSLHDAETGGNALGTRLLAVPVTNGLFNVTLDFGLEPFSAGEAAWLEISVTPDAERVSPPLTALLPRTRLHPTPVANWAHIAGVAGGVTNGAVSAAGLGTANPPAAGQVLAYDGTSLVWQPAAGGSSAWSLQNLTNLCYVGGRVGIGTANPGRLLQLGDAGIQGSQGLLRLISRSGNGAYTRTWEMGVPEGGDGNGDGRNYSFVIDDTVLGSTPEFVIRYASGHVGIGTLNPQARLHVDGSILSGVSNTLNGTHAVIGGGQGNAAGGSHSTVIGGENNQASGWRAVAAGGFANVASGQNSFAAGRGARALHDGSFVWADWQGGATPIPFESTSVNQFNVRASAGVRLQAQEIRIGSSAQLYAPGGEENLRIIRGTVNADGTVRVGSGFGVSNIGTGEYQITFTTPFAGEPTVTTAIQDYASRIAILGLVNATTCIIRTVRPRDLETTAPAPMAATFHFIAIGPR